MFPLGHVTTATLSSLGAGVALYRPGLYAGTLHSGRGRAGPSGSGRGRADCLIPWDMARLASCFKSPPHVDKSLLSLTGCINSACHYTS